MQSRIHLFEVDLDDDVIQKYDMSIYDQAYDAMEKNQDVQMVLDCARRYFAGNHTEKPIWEILSDRNIRITEDVTALLR